MDDDDYDDGCGNRDDDDDDWGNGDDDDDDDDDYWGNRDNDVSLYRSPTVQVQV